MRVSKEAVLDCSVLVPADFLLSSRVVSTPKLLRPTFHTPLSRLLDPPGELGFRDKSVVVQVDLVDHEAEFNSRLLWAQTGKLLSFVSQKGFVVVCLVVITFEKDHK